jgi:hypothetical protein
MLKRFVENPLGKTIVWLLGNTFFGLAPLLLMIWIKKVSSNPNAAHEVYHLVNDGLILFVCCAIMGAVVVDILIFRHKFENIVSFALTLSPISVLFMVLLVYLLIIFKVLSESYFSTESWIYYFVIIFSVVYCTLAKYTMYKKEALNE